MLYEEHLALEAVSVGAVLVVSSKIVDKLLPRLSPTMRMFLSGALVHLTYEYYGINEWYCENSAASRKIPTIVRTPTEAEDSKTQFCPWPECEVLEYI